MDVFTKQVSGLYELVFNYSEDLPPGEIIKSYNVYLDGGHLSGVLSSGIITFYEKYDKETLLVSIESGVHGSTYVITTEILTNRANVFSRDLAIIIDEEDYPYAYENFEYRFQYSSRDKALYILPHLENGFDYNREFNVSISPGISGIYNSPMTGNYNFWFTTQYCPLFTNIMTIKLMGGPDIEGFSEDTIYRYIYKNSLDAVDLYNASNDTSYSYTHWGCTPESIPYSLRHFVECKTAYDLLSILDRIGQEGTGQTKQLGDLTIRYSGKATTSDPGLKKRLYECYMSSCRIVSGPKVAVRGLYDTTKSYNHPVQDSNHNRIVRTVFPSRSNPTGPWEKAGGWREGV